MNRLVSLLAIALTVEAHGFVKLFTIDGTEYPSFNPITDRDYKTIKRIEWGWTGHNTAGVGPVLDVMSPAVACRTNPLPAVLTAPVRAGAPITFKWTNYFTSHKGPLLTYLGEYTPGQNINDVKWFKMAEDSYDPKTGKYATDKLMENNHTYTVTVPSNLKAGRYVLRHEIVSLHFALRGSADKPGTPLNGAEIYPVCININVLGDGTAVPPTIGKFPGIYERSDPGILTNIYYGANKYHAPGPPVWQGEHNPPKGPVPVVTETGYPADPEARAKLISTHQYGDTVLENIVAGFNNVFPGGGGARTASDGNPALNMGSPNKGRGYPLGSSTVPKDGSLVGPIASYTTVGAGAALGMIPPNNALGGPRMATGSSPAKGAAKGAAKGTAKGAAKGTAKGIAKGAAKGAKSAKGKAPTAEDKVPAAVPTGER